MVNRKLPKALPKAMTTSYVAKLLNVSRPTIAAACERWNLGYPVTAPGRGYLALTPKDVRELAKCLQDGPGNLTSGSA